MIKLSERLQIIADRLSDCKTMADIGTDHGFLPAFLIQSGRCTHTIAADISQPSLNKAKELCEELGIKGCTTIVGDGLKVLNIGQVEGVSIAGMGGTLITEILGENMELTCSLKKLVLQPRTAMGYLRKWLLENGFTIIGEDLVYEGKFIPEIITVIPPKKGENEEFYQSGDNNIYVNRENCHLSGKTLLYYDVPPWTVKATGPVKDHIERVLNKELTVLSGLKNASEPDYDRISEKNGEIEYLQGLLREV